MYLCDEKGDSIPMAVVFFLRRAIISVETSRGQGISPFFRIEERTVAAKGRVLKCYSIS